MALERKKISTAKNKASQRERLTFRLEANLVDKFRKIAEAKHSSLESLGREAIDDVLKKHKSSLKNLIIK